VRELSVTTYSILGLLGIKDWTAYELEQQAARSLRFISPRARSVVYAEPKRLVKLGLASAVTEARGRRNVAVYSITDAGREALRTWYKTPAAFPALEAPVLVRTLFAAGGNSHDLVAALEQCGRDAGDLLTAIRAQSAGYQDGGPFPDRLPYIALNGVFLVGWLTWIRDWTRWAAARIAELPADDGDARTFALELLAGLAAGRLPPDLQRLTPG
jgi:PadR family transcriptional regulator, regulatory protein AphA